MPIDALVRADGAWRALFWLPQRHLPPRITDASARIDHLAFVVLPCFVILPDAFRFSPMIFDISAYADIRSSMLFTGRFTLQHIFNRRCRRLAISPSTVRTQIHAFECLDVYCFRTQEHFDSFCQICNIRTEEEDYSYSTAL